jgi:endonuclease/exonuclease/phosphatase family metal-dependent hydrolase
LAEAGESEIVLPDSATAAEDDDPRRVRFTAWNLKNYLHVAAPPPEGSTEKTKPPRERAAIVAMLAQIHPDILGVCEMGSAADLAVLQAELKTAGLDLPQTEWVEGADPSRHLALLTRFPIASRQPVTNQRYVLDDSQFPVQRGFLDVTLAVNESHSLRLLGTHLKSRMDTPEADQELMRRNEAHLLRQHIDTVLTAEPQANLLVYGDFNDTRDQPSVKAIKGMRGAAAALTEIPATDDSGERWTFYYPEADEYSRIDFLLASSALLPEVRRTKAFLPGGRGWSRASDHRPVTVDLIADDNFSTSSRSKAKSRSTTRSRAKSQTPPPAPAAADSAPEN